MKTEKSTKNPISENIENKDFKEPGTVNTLSQEFSEANDIAFDSARKLIFKDKDARIIIEETDGAKSAKVIDGDGKIVFYTKWPNEVSILEEQTTYEQK